MDIPPCEVRAIYICVCGVYGVFYKGGACEAPPCETHAVYVWRIISQQTGSVLGCAMGYGAAAAAAALVAMPTARVQRALAVGDPLRYTLCVCVWRISQGGSVQVLVLAIAT